MFNFQNITSYEFELLARDIMQKKLDIELRTYAAGRDGGIDIRGFIGNEIIIQAKHYVKSNFSNLRGALKKELVKIKKLKPKRYIIVTSFSLTPDNEDYIYNLFKDYMVDKRDIVDINFLNTFLENEDNIDILKKHNKLWLTSTNVLNMIFSREIDFDSRSFMQDYEEKSRLFVYSKAYYDTLNILEKNNILILEGAPGVGKSTLSKMLVADFCEKGYKFLYASSNSISEIKKGITPTEKEIILMDNFLGQRVTDISSHFFSEFKLLIDFVISNNDKKIIVNSRSIVLNEAISTNQAFKDSLEYHDICRYDIKVEDMSDLEKSQILYNHIYMSNLPTAYFEAIKMDAHYLDIVSHKNFSPRIIEYVTRNARVSNMDSSEYFSYILKTLNNPKDIWKDEFLNLCRIDKIYIFILYTLISFKRSGSEFVNSEILQECFEYRLRKEHNIDSTINHFECITDKFAGGLIQLNISTDKASIGFINPSVEDYVYECLRNLDSEIREIASSAIYLEQLLILSKLSINAIKDVVVEKIQDKSFLSLKKYTDLREHYHFLRFIFEYDCKFSNLKESVYKLFNMEKAFSREREDNANLIMDFFFEKDMYTFFELHNLLYNDSLVERIFEYLNFSQITQFLHLYEITLNPNKDANLVDEFIDKFVFFINWEIELDIINNSRTRLDEGIAELKKTIGELEDRSREKFDSYKRSFIEQCLIPLVNERKKDLVFSPIVEHLNINEENILSEISFPEALFYDSSEEYGYRENKSRNHLLNDYEAIVNLFDAEFTS